MTDLTYAQIDQTILNTLERPRPRYWFFVALVFCGVLLGAGAWTYQIFVGIGVGGQNIPVVWGTYLINFVFWVGIAHSGTLISAILHLFRAGWRNPIARAAETMTVFAVCVAGLFPFIHLGRVWQVYFMLPIPNQRFLWPNFLSPLVFDVVAISTYLTVSSLFWYTGLVPDLAVVRDRSTGLRYKIFRILSLGWTGAHHQWLNFSRGYLFFAALATPLVISVHSVVSWDFALGDRPGMAHHHFRTLLRGRRHPLGAGHGFDPHDPAAAHLPLRAIITMDILENVAKTIILTGLIVGLAYGTEFFIAWYSHNPVEWNPSAGG